VAEDDEAYGIVADDDVRELEGDGWFRGDQGLGCRGRHFAPPDRTEAALEGARLFGSPIPTAFFLVGLGEGLRLSFLMKAVIFFTFLPGSGAAAGGGAAAEIGTPTTLPVGLNTPTKVPPSLDKVRVFFPLAEAELVEE